MQNSPMLTRFCIYGFLKNQQYYEPFMILAFLEKGLSFLEIGLLVGFRELCKMLLEIPSGAAADLYGRRRAMVFSFASYIASFILFALAKQTTVIFVAMALFALGEAFRTGTHKAMIFDWLRHEKMLDQRTRVYGLTRSWSKIGSAVSAPVAAGIVLLSGNYSAIFWICAIPYSVGIVNFLTYPTYLDGAPQSNFSILEAHRLTISTVRDTLKRSSLRLLVLESMLLEGIFKVARDYFQPILVALALSITLSNLDWLGDITIDESKKSALLIGGVYFIYFLIMSVASRNAHRFCAAFAGEERATRALWMVNTGAFAMIGIACLLELPVAAVPAFIVLALVQNLFRPSQIARIDKVSDSKKGATVLSVESWAKAMAVVILAPIVGGAVELLQNTEKDSIVQFIPLATLGVIIGMISLTVIRRKHS